jgi:hypothetical protein
MNSNAAFLPALILIVAVMISGVVQSTQNSDKKLFGLGSNIEHKISTQADSLF